MSVTRAALIGVLLLTLATPAEAQWSKSFRAACTPNGVVPACASVDIWNSLDVNTGIIELGIRITNLEGSRGFENLTPGVGIKGWYLHSLYFLCTAPAFGCEPIIGRASVLELNRHRGIDEWRVSTEVGGGYTVGHTPETNDDARIFGCNPPRPEEFDPVSYSELTCDSPLEYRVIDGEHARGGYVVSQYTELTVYYDRGDFGPSFGCTTSRHPVISSGGDRVAGSDLTMGLPRCVRVPEPSSLLLLATGVGIVVIGGWRERRA